MRERPPDAFDRDEVVVCMVLALSLAGALVTVSYRVLS